MTYSKFVLLLLFIFLLKELIGQCTCDPLPPSTGTIITVSTVSELDDALDQANGNNGNMTIELNNGTYQLTSNLRFISSNMSNLTIRSVSGNRDGVIIRGQGALNSSVTHIFNVAADNFTVADITIGWVWYHPIQVHSNPNDADNILIHNVRFVDGKEQLLKVSGGGSLFADNGIVECCLFEFTAGVGFQWYTGGIDAHRSKDWIVRYNTFKDIRSPDNPGNIAEHAIHFWRESSGTHVEANVIIDCDRGIGFGLGNSVSNGHDDGLILNNFVHTSRDVGIGLEYAPNADVYNNTVVTDNYFNSIEYRFAGTNNVHIANNLCTESITSRQGGTGTIESNIADHTDMTIFVDPNNYDYHLKSSGTVAIDQGMTLAVVTTDIDCGGRTAGSAPDLGADEFLPAGCDPLYLSNNNSGGTAIEGGYYTGSLIEVTGNIMPATLVELKAIDHIELLPDLVVNSNGELVVRPDGCP